MHFFNSRVAGNNVESPCNDNIDCFPSRLPYFSTWNQLMRKYKYVASRFIVYIPSFLGIPVLNVGGGGGEGKGLSLIHI